MSRAFLWIVASLMLATVVTFPLTSVVLGRSAAKRIYENEDNAHFDNGVVIVDYGTHDQQVMWEDDYHDASVGAGFAAGLCYAAAIHGFVMMILTILLIVAIVTYRRPIDHRFTR